MCTADKWKDVDRRYYKKLREKEGDKQRQLAKTISQLVKVPFDRPASLNDIAKFENVLDVRVMVVSARLGNKFITSSSTDKRPCVYVYLVDDDHFHAITSITGVIVERLDSMWDMDLMDVASLFKDNDVQVRTSGHRHLFKIRLVSTTKKPKQVRRW